MLKGGRIVKAMWIMLFLASAGLSRGLAFEPPRTTEGKVVFWTVPVEPRQLGPSHTITPIRFTSDPFPPNPFASSRFPSDPFPPDRFEPDWNIFERHSRRHPSLHSPRSSGRREARIPEQGHAPR